MARNDTPVLGEERGLLEAARRGDEHAFAALAERYRMELHAHCYRMLGSVHDAEDAMQETLLRAWRALGRFEERSSLRAWLYTIATNVCLSLIARRPKRVLPLDYGPAADPHDGPGEPLLESVWLEPYPDERLGPEGAFASPEARYEVRESVELAFVAALQHLPPRQRAVLILREVLGFSGAEVANALDTTPAAVYTALQRAHKTVDARLPQLSQQATLRSLGDERLRRLVDRYVEAWESGDADAILAMLTEDASYAMPPLRTWYRGREAIGVFLAGWPLAAERRWRVVPASANGQLAFGTYVRRPTPPRYRADAVDVLTLDARGRIEAVTAFVDPAAFRRFGLPDHLEPPS
jgi:RNA polymerase sigma-70 factor (ECF subfamily)